MLNVGRIRTLLFCRARNTEALRQMAVGPVREGDTAEPHAEVRPQTHRAGQREPRSRRGASRNHNQEPPRVAGKLVQTLTAAVPPRRWTRRPQMDSQIRQDVDMR